MKVIWKICRLLILILAVLILLNLEGISQTQKQMISQARISYLSGKSLIQHASSLLNEEAGEGMQLMEGDRIGTTDGRMEIDLGNGNCIRLDRNTKIDFTRLPRSASRFTQIRLWSGSAIIRLGFLENEKNLEISTPDVTAYFLDRGMYRLDVEEDKKTQIHVFSGLLEAAGEFDSILLKKSQSASAVQGRTPHPAFPVGMKDDFFNWNKEREEQIRRQFSRRNHHVIMTKSKGRGTSVRPKRKHLPPNRINQMTLQRIHPAYPVNRLYKYISGNKSKSIEKKNYSVILPEQSINPPQKIRPPTKKDPGEKK